CDRLRFARSRCKAALSHARTGATQDRVNAYDARMPKTPASANAEGFAALGLDARLVAALTSLGYEEPTPIQGQTIRPLIEGRDLLGQAATGTGKTAAFALPILQRIVTEGRGEGPMALVLVPT